MKKHLLPILLLAVLSSLSPATTKQELTEAYDELVRPRLDDHGASPVAYDAFRKLIMAGEDGWELIFSAQFSLGKTGNTTRCISSLWETSGISEELLTRFEQAERKELPGRSQNETWALLYAQNYEESRHPKSTPKGTTHFDYLGQFIHNLETSKDSFLMDVAFLRVNLTDKLDFPGHTFPWNGSAQQKSTAIQTILHWWKIHGKELKEP